ncbi:glutathione S-transferase protein-like protein [Aulographum hederae CBS 113979]|uniref:Glutathione S-transferase protein-like protein n=1 Tax=Aulographum hederae CBS 113979 TaxID=1176131 RepID=A0A6G1GW71_9PEZI|nr:glutathione S-transferase protein-like protein [Aulographum hederae CBS 113979]
MSPPTYELLYHPSIPGRGEYIRLFLEATSTPYTDVGQSSYDEVRSICCSPSSLHDAAGNPPPFAPPALRVKGEGKNGGDLVISQTGNVLMYLAERTGELCGDGGGQERWWVQGLAMTALDLSNETHDTHHPVAVMDYYEDQKEESLRKAKDFRANRIPKFFGYFERVLKGNEKEGKGKYLVGSKLTYADTTIWHVLDGLLFAYPKELAARKKDYPILLDTFYKGIKEEKGIKEYLESGRRFPFSMGLFRKYPELDRQ